MRALAFILPAPLLVLLAGCHEPSHPLPRPPLPAQRVKLAMASTNAWIASEAVLGTVRPRLRATVEAKAAGRIESFPAVPGQRVQPGDLLALLDSREPRARLDSARATADQARRDRDRVARLVGQGAATPAELDAVDARLRVAEAAVSEAETMLGHARVTAPFAGTITRKHADVGDLATPGRPLVELEDPSRLRLEADVPEALVASVPLGSRMVVHAGADTRPIDATVSEVAPVADSISRTHLVKLDLPPLPGLRSGQFGRVAVPSGAADVLHVPRAALLLRGQLEFVMVADRGVARLRLVRSGMQDSGRVALLSGLAVGEQVVVSGLDNLRDGQPVEVEP